MRCDAWQCPHRITRGRRHPARASHAFSTTRRRKHTSNHSWINQAPEWLGSIKLQDVFGKIACDCSDVSLHGSPQIPTPHIDGLARAGLTLLNYHANPSCSPTRASILTGRHMIHHSIFGPFRIGFAGALDTAFTLLPQYLQQREEYLRLADSNIGTVGMPHLEWI